MIHNIILDLGGVLLKTNYDAPGENFRKLGLSGLRNVFFEPGPNNLLHRFERGQINGDSFAQELLQLAPIEVTVPQIQYAWNSILDGIWPDTIPLLQVLRQKFRIFLWSNINDWHLDAYQLMLLQSHPELNFEQLFEKVYYSCRIGHRKPDPEGFELILNQNSLIPEHTVFVDDLMENVIGAKALGIRGLHLDLMQGDALSVLLKREGLL